MLRAHAVGTRAATGAGWGTVGPMAAAPALLAAHTNDPHSLTAAVGGVYPFELTPTEAALFANPHHDAASAAALLARVTDTPTGESTWWRLRRGYLDSATSPALRAAICDSVNGVPTWAVLRCGWLDVTHAAKLLHDAKLAELDGTLGAVEDRFTGEWPGPITDAVCHLLGRWFVTGCQVRSVRTARLAVRLTDAMRHGRRNWFAAPRPDFDAGELVRWLDERKRGAERAVAARDLLAHRSCELDSVVTVIREAAAGRWLNCLLDDVCSWLNAHPGGVDLALTVLVDVCSGVAELAEIAGKLNRPLRGGFLSLFDGRIPVGTAREVALAAIVADPGTAETLHLAHLAATLEACDPAGAPLPAVPDAAAAVGALIEARCGERTAALFSLWANNFDGTLGELFDVLDGVTV